MHNARMSKQAQWIVGLNAVASALEHDAEHVREVLLEAGGKNPRIVEIEQEARRKDIDVRRVAQSALDGVSGGVRHQGAAALCHLLSQRGGPVTRRPAAGGAPRAQGAGVSRMATPFFRVCTCQPDATSY